MERSVLVRVLLVLSLSVGVYAQVASIRLEKLTMGQDADTPPGPSVEVGSLVEWTYVVTNNGSVPLDHVFIIDDQNVVVRCPLFSLAPGETMECMGREPAQAGQYQNAATVFATDPSGMEISDSDLSHYYGGSFDVAIDVEKSTNGFDADEAPGPSITVGDPVVWEYVVTNTGTTLLTDIVVTDNRGVAVSCPTTSLMPNESMTCTAQGVATLGQYSNVALVSAFGPNGASVSDVDTSHYLGVNPNLSLTVDLLVNGIDADDPPGPTFNAGDALTWSFVVTNTGSDTLTDLAVFDAFGLVGRCNTNVIGPGETLVCTANDFAVAGAMANVGTATARGPSGEQVQATDPCHYVGLEVARFIGMEKWTNGVDADFPPGPVINVGDPVEWTYVVSNLGQETLTNIVVTDDQGVAVSCAPIIELLPGQSVTCTGSGTAQAGQYVNTATVTATRPNGTSVSASDRSHYFGDDFELSVDIEALANGVDADTPPGPTVNVGSVVSFTFEVTNTSSVTLHNINVTNSANLVVRCSGTSLEPGASMICTARQAAQPGQFAMVATVTADDGAGNQARDSDATHYFGQQAAPQISLQKLTNGEDADLAPGPSVLEGTPVVWSYVVSNTGSVTLFNVTVNDDQEGEVSCPMASLEPGASMTCTISGVAQLGQYQNLGVATGTSSTGQTANASDPSHYLGVSLPPEIDIEKMTNGEQADEAPGPLLNVGQSIEWTYLVTNTGEVAVEDIAVTDDQIGAITCPSATLEPGESMICTATGEAVRGQYENLGSVVVFSASGQQATDTDPSHYFGVGQGADGCSHGYWKNHPESWVGYAPEDLLVDVFEQIALYPELASDTLDDGLRYGGGPGALGGAKNLIKQAVASLLNGAHPSIDFTYSDLVVRVLVNNALATLDRNEMLKLAEALDEQNNTGCNLDAADDQ